MGLTIDSLKGQRVSVNALAQITKLDRRTVSKYLDAEEVDAEGAAKDYDFLKAIPALMRSTKGQNSADRKNDAQAHKCELEAAILEGLYIPIADVAQIVRAFLGAVNREIQASEIEDEKKERIVEKLRDAEFGIEELTETE